MPNQTLFDVVLALQMLGAGTLAGLYFIFSVCVMPALDEVGGETAIAVMNAINVKIIKPFFLLLFMGTPVLSAGFLVLLCREYLDSIVKGAGGAATDAATDSARSTSSAASRTGDVFAGGGEMFVPRCILLGATLILLGEFGVTAGLNVPLNDALAAGEIQQWEEYSKPWTLWNSVRGGASAAATLCFAAAALQSGRGGPGTAAAGEYQRTLLH